MNNFCRENNNQYYQQREGYIVIKTGIVCSEPSTEVQNYTTQIAQLVAVSQNNNKP